MSLATKYRPNLLSEVAGHLGIIKNLKQVIKDGRVKSFIFTGPSGCGKTTLARVTANILSVGIAEASNLIEVDAASKSGADDMRDLVARARYLAVGSSPVKVIIIDESHRLSAAAWTVLLKPIEEPPSHVYWMLATTEASKIPQTIITRCVRYDLKPLSEDDLLSLLVKVCDAEGIKTCDEVLIAIADGAGGSPRQALTYLESCAACATADEARQIMRQVSVESKEAIDLCRFLLKRNGRSWSEAVKLIKSMEGVEAESIRVVVVNYLTKVLLSTTDERQAQQLLMMLEAFFGPYSSSDKLAPLLLSVGAALGLGH